MYEKELKAYFVAQKDQMLADVAALVGINSTRTAAIEGKPYGAGAAECLDKASELLEDYGFAVKNHDYHVITADMGPDPRKLDILAHLDVVPAGGGWTVCNPFEMKILDGRIYGRGTADDKGPAICALYAMRAICELGLPLKHGVRLILGSDEECGSSDLAYYYSKESPASMSFSPDSKFPLVNVEKGGLQSGFSASVARSKKLSKVLSICGGEKVNIIPDFAECKLKGVAVEEVLHIVKELSWDEPIQIICKEGTGEDSGTLMITVKGTTAHGSSPEKGCNAVTALLELLTKLPLAECPLHEKLRYLNHFFPHGKYHGESFGINLEDERAGKTTLSLTTLEYDGEHIRGQFDCRASLKATDENTTKVIAKRLRECGFIPKEGHMYPPHVVDENSELVQGLLKAYETVTGVPGKPLTIGGGTYVHHIENGVAFGCAELDVDNRMHGPDEFMVIDQMIKSCEIFAQAILNLCG